MTNEVMNPEKKKREKRNGMYRVGNSYCFRFYFEGKRHNKTWKIPNELLGKSQNTIEKEATRQYDKFHDTILKGIDSKKMTFRQLSDNYIKAIEKDAKPNTVKSHKQNLKRINQYLGDKEVKRIVKKDIRDFIAEVQKPYKTKNGIEKTLSPVTVNDLIRTISSVLSFGVEEDILETNIIVNARGKGLGKPKVETGIPKVIPEDVLRQYCSLMMSEEVDIKYRAFFFLCLTTGMRRGEVCGLSWSDIDLDNGTLTIKENSQLLEDGSIVFVKPKTKASERCIKLNPSVVEMLKELQHQQKLHRLETGIYWKKNPANPKEEYCENHNECNSKCKGYCSKHCRMFKDTNRVFIADNGTPIYPKVPYDFINRLGKRHNLPHISIHQLRHTAVSLFIRDGIPLTEIASYVGHSNIHVTSTVYAHDVAEMNKAKEIKVDMMQFVKEA